MTSACIKSEINCESALKIITMLSDVNLPQWNYMHVLIGFNGYFLKVFLMRCFKATNRRSRYETNGRKEKKIGISTSDEGERGRVKAAVECLLI